MEESIDFSETLTGWTGEKIWYSLLGTLIGSRARLWLSQLAGHQNTASCHQNPRWQTQSPVWPGIHGATPHKTTHLLL